MPTIPSIILSIALSVISAHPQKQFQTNRDPVFCMSQGIYYEARGGSIAESAAVGYVIKSRAQSEYFNTKTYCGVYHAKYQFYDAAIKKVLLSSDFEQDAWNNSVWIAMGVEYETIPNPAPEAVYFCNPKKTNAGWCKYSDGVMVGRQKFITQAGYRTSPKVIPKKKK